MDGSISRLGGLISGGVLARALTPAVTTFPARTRSLRDRTTDATNELGVTARAAGAGLGALARRLSAVREAAARLSLGTANGAFAARRMTSAAAGVVSGTASVNAARHKFIVQVTSVAAAQVDLTTPKAASASTGINPGANTLTITTGGKTTAFTFEIAARYTQLETLTNLAWRIKAANVGVRARVISQDVGGTPGAARGSDRRDAAFAVQDRSGNLVAALEAGTVAATASNAHASVDGTPYASATNQIQVPAGNVALAVRQTTAEAVSLRVESDVPGVLAAVQRLAESLNALGEGGSESDAQAGSAVRTALLAAAAIPPRRRGPRAHRDRAGRD
ncbi:MAG: hypothetical protein FJ029_10185 [Actinobacteria bacterium]|nr:hypothetical protein [Actinomycetota bacterium]